MSVHEFLELVIKLAYREKAGIINLDYLFEIHENDIKYYFSFLDQMIENKTDKELLKISCWSNYNLACAFKNRGIYLDTNKLKYLETTLTDISKASNVVEHKLVKINSYIQNECHQGGNLINIENLKELLNPAYVTTFEDKSYCKKIYIDEIMTQYYRLFSCGHSSTFSVVTDLEKKYTSSFTTALLYFLNKKIKDKSPKLNLTPRYFNVNKCNQLIDITDQLK
jgi:hypothetical protein